MKRPTSTVKSMQAKFRRYQLLTCLCALLTLCAVMLAAVSGVRIQTLSNSRKAQSSGILEAQTAAFEKELEQTRGALENAMRQLDAEKEQVSILRGRIEVLERRLAEKSRTSPEAFKPDGSPSPQVGSAAAYAPAVNPQPAAGQAAPAPPPDSATLSSASVAQPSPQPPVADASEQTAAPAEPEERTPPAADTVEKEDG